MSYQEAYDELVEALAKLRRTITQMIEEHTDLMKALSRAQGEAKAWKDLFIDYGAHLSNCKGDNDCTCGYTEMYQETHETDLESKAKKDAAASKERVAEKQPEA